MELIELTRRTHLFTCKAINVLTSLQYTLRDRKKYADYTKKNVTLKNISEGETCYILGNGPSLNRVDLSKLKGKHIITVNKFILTSMYSELKPEYHCVIDRFILEQVKDAVKEDLEDNNSLTKFLLHRTGIDKIGRKDRAYYIYNRHFPVNEDVHPDLTRNASTFYNVLPFTAMCAIYMGFKRIVLLGNDFSFFTARKDQHFYDIDEKKERQESLYQDLTGCSIVLLQYRALRKYCEKHGIEIVNATEGTLLDEIKQVKLEDYL